MAEGSQAKETPLNLCRFCGPTTAELTKEELFPKWFSKFMRKIGVNRQYQASRTSYNGIKTTWRPWTIDSAVHGVCTVCNNETLSELENLHFKPLIERTAAHEKVPMVVQEQAVMNAWITRFAMISDLQNEDADGAFFTADERKAFIENLEPPQDAWIWLAVIYSTFPAGCSQSINYFSDGSNALICTGIVGRVVFQFLLRRWNEPRPSDEAIARAMAPSLIAFANASVQIFPNVWNVARWPPPQYLDNDSFKPFADRWGGSMSGLE